jgi:hypothetical protein
MMKTRKILNPLLLAILMSAVLATLANAQDPAQEALNKRLSGTYASTSSWSCIQTSDVFGTFFDEDLAIQPVGSDSRPSWQTQSTTVTYNGDGTGSEVGTIVSVEAAGAVSAEISCDLTYVVNSDQSFEVTKQCNGLLTFFGGTDIPFSVEFVEKGRMQNGGRVLITGTEEPRIHTGDFPTLGFQNQSICVRSGTQIKLSGN